MFFTVICESDCCQMLSRTTAAIIYQRENRHCGSSRGTLDFLGSFLARFMRIQPNDGVAASYHHKTPFRACKAFNRNCMATAASNRPMMRVPIFKAIGLSQRAPRADQCR